MMILRVCATAMVIATAISAAAQVTPAAGYTPPDDTPSIKVGATLYMDYTFQTNPTATDADGNTISPNAFNVARSYINITGNLSHIVAFRITPDVVRESGLVTLATGNTISNDSLVFRIKYAYAQFNLDDWMTRGSWVRLGIHQTPLLDYEESIYRYRFQGTTFTEREGYYNSADAGASFHWNIPNNYGEVHVGVYNGDGYARNDPNDQKAIEVRGTVRPFAGAAPIARGLRVTGFYFGDNYIKDAERTRAVGQVTFESHYLNAGFDAIKAHDQPSIAKPDVASSGWSFWATPRKPFENGSSWEALLRYDHLTPNTALDTQTRNRTIAGISYWFPHQGTVSCALMLDYDGQMFDNFTPFLPAQTKVAVHGLINF
ncbi:MAG TPA: porin [Vicinamibacterales bacterium]|nr:porin [Vicinamibacterales bacterium]